MKILLAAEPRVKGIAEDAFRAMVDEEKTKAARRKEEQATAADVPSAKQHKAHKTDGALQKKVKTAQDAKMSKQHGLRELQAKLAKLNTKRPTDPEKIRNWTKRRRALAEKIAEKRNSIRLSDSRVASMRKEVREN